MKRSDKENRKVHLLTDDGMVLCNARDKEAAHRAAMNDIATTENPKAATCDRCVALYHKRKG
jgi:hypothetical protein